MEAIPFSGSHSIYWKPLLLVETNSFKDLISFSESISCSENNAFSGSHSFQWNPFLVVASFCWNSGP